jgi:hypothetical protein
MNPWLGFYFAVIAVWGYALSAALWGSSRRRLIELIATSATFGYGAVALLLIWLSMLGVKPSRLTIIFLAAIASGLILLMAYNHRLPRIARPIIPRLRLLEIFFFALATVILLVQLAAAAATLAQPPFEIDAVAIWGLKAKVLYFEPLHPMPAYFHDLTLSYSHLDYPLLVPMLWAGAFGAIGSINDLAAQKIFLLPLPALYCLLYSLLRHALSREKAALLTAIAIGAPVMARWAGQPVADAALSLFFLGAVGFLWRWLEKCRVSDAIATGLFAAMAACTKFEGMAMIVSIVGITIITMLITKFRRERLIGGAALLIACFVLLVPWLIWSRGLPHTHENYGSRLNLNSLHAGLSRIPDILEIFSTKIDFWPWITPAGILALAAIIGWRAWSKPVTLAIWSVLLAQLLAYFVIFLVTPWDLAELIPMILMRLILHVLPIWMLLAGIHWQHSSPQERILSAT